MNPNVRTAIKDAELVLALSHIDAILNFLFVGLLTALTAFVQEWLLGKCTACQVSIQLTVVNVFGRYKQWSASRYSIGISSLVRLVTSPCSLVGKTKVYVRRC